MASEITPLKKEVSHVVGIWKKIGENTNDQWKFKVNDNLVHVRIFRFQMILYIFDV